MQGTDLPLRRSGKSRIQGPIFACTDCDFYALELLWWDVSFLIQTDRGGNGYLQRFEALHFGRPAKVGSPCGAHPPRGRERVGSRGGCLHAPWHSYFGPGTPQTVKVGRFFKIIWLLTYLYPSNVWKYQACGITSYNNYVVRSQQTAEHVLKS